MRSPAVLLLLTQKFPFESGEEFLAPELARLAVEFDRIILVPTAVRDYSAKRQLPPNVELRSIANPASASGVALALLRHFPRCLLLFFSQLASSGWNWKLGKYWLYHIPFALTIKGKLKRYLKEDGEIVLYSYWMDTNAYALSMLKREFPAAKLVVRTHGGDLYDERSPAGQIAFRQSVYEEVDALWPISQHGVDYISGKYPSVREKMRLARLGVEDRGLGPATSTDASFRIISCSSIIPVKRVGLIAEILLEARLPIQWVHFGGDIGQIEEIQRQLGDGRPGLEVIWKGKVSNHELMDYYSDNFVDTLINLSASEGIPVSMMEAISFGIPVFANDVGGISEIVSENTGCLVEDGLSKDDQLAAFEGWLSSGKTRDREFREGVRRFWQSSYHAEQNHASFKKRLDAKTVTT